MILYLYLYFVFDVVLLMMIGDGCVSMDMLGDGLFCVVWLELEKVSIV